MTHDELVERGVKWLKRACSGRGVRYRGACGVVVPELVSFTPEQPDVIGWLNGGVSHMIECKASRSDFLSDVRKPHRKHSSGTFRWYLCTPGMITRDECPASWGLLYCHPRKITVEIDAPLNEPRNVEAELSMMYSLLRRVEVRGELTRCLAPKWGGDCEILATPESKDNP